MRMFARLIGPAVALGLLVLGPRIVFSQAPQSEDEEFERQERVKCELTQCVVGRAPVVGAPFTATATTVWRPAATSGRPEMRASSRYFRDGAGRIRVEQGFADDDRGPRRILVVPDPDGRKAYMLNPAERTAEPLGRGLAEMVVGGGGNYRFLLPLPEKRFISFHQAPGTEGGGEPLGERYLAGVRTTGTSFALRLPTGTHGRGRAERWIAPELKLVVYLHGEDSAIGTVEYQLTEIDLAEPEPGLFEVPADYTVVSPRGTLRFLNPYAPENWGTR